MRIALVFALLLSPALALAAAPPSDSKAPPPNANTGKAKNGDACKAHSDCDSNNCVNNECAVKIMPPT